MKYLGLVLLLLIGLVPSVPVAREDPSQARVQGEGLDRALRRFNGTARLNGRLLWREQSAAVTGNEPVDDLGGGLYLVYGFYPIFLARDAAVSVGGHGAVLVSEDGLVLAEAMTEQGPEYREHGRKFAKTLVVVGAQISDASAVNIFKAWMVRHDIKEGDEPVVNTPLYVRRLRPFAKAWVWDGKRRPFGSRQ